jgi:uncharacterized protein with GYD domain
MPIYVRLVTLTEQGIRGIKGFQKAFEEIKKIHEEEGARLIGAYATLGRYDFVAILEAPDDKTAMKLSAKVGSMGNLKIETLPAIPIEEFGKMTEEL